MHIDFDETPASPEGDSDVWHVSPMALCSILNPAKFLHFLRLVALVQIELLR